MNLKYLLCPLCLEKTERKKTQFIPFKSPGYNEDSKAPINVIQGRTNRPQGKWDKGAWKEERIFHFEVGEEKEKLEKTFWKMLPWSIWDWGWTSAFLYGVVKDDLTEKPTFEQ